MSRIDGAAADYLLPADSRLRTLAARARAVAIAGGVLSIIGMWLDREQFFRSWLIAFLFWMGPALGSVGILSLQYLTGGRWGTALRRTLEAAGRTLSLMFVFFVPVVIGMHELYEWSHIEVLAHDELLRHKSIYLNPVFFVVRAAFFFACWIGVAYFLSRWSLEQDDRPSEGVGRRLHFMGRGGLCIYAVTMTFAAFDWGMSLDPHWYSHIYGVIVIGGQILTAMLFATAVAVVLADHEPVGRFITADRFHDMGKLLMAFIMLWAYFALSQFLIIWSANLPEETPWYLARMSNGWQYLGGLLILFHFVLPFGALLSRTVKRDPAMLGKVVLGLLVMRYVDLYWLIAPSFHPDAVSFHWLDLATMTAIGGLWLASFVRNLDGKPVLPLNDPYLAGLENVMSHGGPQMGGTTTGYETRDVSARSVFVGAAIGTLLVVGSFLAMWWLFFYLNDREALLSAPRHPLAEIDAPRVPPQPRLQSDPRLDLFDMRAREDELLGSYGWVDRAEGVVRVPIERAIDLYLERAQP